MAEFDPALRPLEPNPLTPMRERKRRNHDHDFDLERELAGRKPAEGSDNAPQEPAHADTGATPVAPRAEDEAGGHLDVTA